MKPAPTIVKSYDAIYKNIKKNARTVITKHIDDPKETKDLRLANKVQSNLKQGYRKLRKKRIGKNETTATKNKEGVTYVSAKVELRPPNLTRGGYYVMLKPTIASCTVPNTATTHDAEATGDVGERQHSNSFDHTSQSQIENTSF